MLELSNLYDPAGAERARAAEDARLAEALARSPKPAEQAQESEADRLVRLRELAKAGLTRVAELDDRVRPEENLEIIASRHAAGHNRTLPH